MKAIGKLLLMTMTLLFILGIILAIGLVIFDKNSVQGVASLNQFFEQQKIMFTGFRISLIALVFWQWNRLISRLANFYKWDDDMRLMIIDSRWKILGWFVLFEIIINQNLMGYVLN